MWITAAVIILLFGALGLPYWAQSRASAENLTAYLPLVISAAAPTMAADFVATFDGDPSAPTRWSSADWDVTVHARSLEHRYSLAAMAAGHGPDCSPPPATHTITAYEDTVYLCRNHIMTAINEGGYGLIYLTPNHMLDFSEGEAVLRFDVSTARNSPRDWIDVWVTPYEDNLQLPLTDWLPDLSGEPRRALHFELGTFFSGGAHSHWTAKVVNDFSFVNEYDGTQWIGWEDLFTPSSMIRTTHEIRISKNHISICVPAHFHCWVDQTIPTLNWDKGIVQLGHHSYNPAKDCDDCGPNTWHWDNVSISPAAPFTMIHSDRRYVDPTTSSTINLDAPAPANAHLRFAGIGEDLEVSVDNGQTWQQASPQHQESYEDGTYWSYWTPIPKGTEHVSFRGQNWWGGSWHVRDITVWSTVVP